MKTFDTMKTPVAVCPVMDRHSAAEQVRGLQGRVRVVVEEGGFSTEVFEDHNLIVNGAKMVMANLLATAPSTYKIGNLELGTMGHDPVGGILVPVPPEVGDEGLNDTSADRPDLAQSIPPVVGPAGVENTVMFTYVLDKADGNGDGVVAYTEAGLFTVSGIMFARETFPAIVKTSARKITFEWSIIF